MANENRTRNTTYPTSLLLRLEHVVDPAWRRKGPPTWQLLLIVKIWGRRCPTWCGGVLPLNLPSNSEIMSNLPASSFAFIFKVLVNFALNQLFPVSLSLALIFVLLNSPTSTELAQRLGGGVFFFFFHLFNFNS